MKKTFILLFALLPIWAMAQVTPEAVIGLCPQMPTAAELAAINQDAVDAFVTKISKAIKQAEAANKKQIEASAGKYKSDLNASLKNQYGKSADELEAMSEEQRKSFAESYAKQKLQGAGINKTVAEIEKMSDAEKQAMAAQMATNITGLSAADMQKLAKMENMSDEEALAYLQQTGMLGKVQNMGMNISQANIGKNSSNSVSVEKMAKNMKTESDYNSEVASFISKRKKSRETLLESARNLYNTKYRAKIESLEKRLGEVSDPLYPGDAETVKALMKSLKNELDNLNVEYRTAIATPWLEQTLKEMAQIKALIPSARKADAANEELMKMRGDAVVLQQEAISWAMEYLHTASNVTEFMPSL